MAIDVLGKKFLEGGLHQRILRLCGGNEKLAREWWDTPNKAFNLNTPRQLMTDDKWDTVRAYIVSKAEYTGARFDFGPTGRFYNKLEQDTENYHYTNDSVQKHMENTKNHPRTSFQGKRLVSTAEAAYIGFVYDENAFTKQKIFTHVPIGRPDEERHVLISISLHNNTATLNTVRINGVYAEILGQLKDDNGTIAFAMAYVPESDMGEIHITTDVDVTNYLIGVWALTGLAKFTPYDIKTAEGTEGTATSITLSTVFDGVAIMVISSSSGQDHAIANESTVSSNLTRKFDGYQLTLAKCNIAGAQAITDGNDMTFTMELEPLVGSNSNTPAIAVSFY
jgi:hypothetical protein